MTSKELQKLMESLRANGITYLRTHELEVRLNGSEPIAELSEDEGLSRINPPQDLPPESVSTDSPTDPKSDEKAAGDVPHKVEELTSLMKLSDQELLNRLFPEPPKDEQE
jgi:hypothetical protein